MEVTDLLPASKVLVYTSFFTRNVTHTESLSGPFGKDRVFRQHVRAVGTESQEDTFGWTSPEALPKTVPLIAQAQREAEGNTGFAQGGCNT